MKKTRVSLVVGGERKVWILSYGQVWLLRNSNLPWTREQALGDCGSRAVQMLNGLEEAGLMRKIGSRWKRTALGTKVRAEIRNKEK
jgi:hypothetical protein